jgi:hypothetical protein
MRQRNWAMGLVSACLFVAAGSVAAAEEGKAEEGWAQLFNGKDLTGWKKHPADKAKWEVVDGTLVGTGPTGHLFSERGDYANFHFRIEAKINDKWSALAYGRGLARLPTDSNFQIVELQKGTCPSAQFVCDHRCWLTSKGGNYRYKNAASLQGFNKTAKIAIAGK